MIVLTRDIWEWDIIRMFPLTGHGIRYPNSSALEMKRQKIQPD